MNDQSGEEWVVPMPYSNKKAGLILRGPFFLLVPMVWTCADWGLGC